MFNSTTAAIFTSSTAPIPACTSWSLPVRLERWQTFRRRATDWDCNGRPARGQLLRQRTWELRITSRTDPCESNHTTLGSLILLLRLRNYNSIFLLCHGEISLIHKFAI